MLEALKALSVFFTENSLRTRRNLRGDIERRSLSINEDFARMFKDVNEVASIAHLRPSPCNSFALIRYQYEKQGLISLKHLSIVLHVK